MVPILIKKDVSEPGSNDLNSRSETTITFAATYFGHLMQRVGHNLVTEQQQNT